MKYAVSSDAMLCLKAICLEVVPLLLYLNVVCDLHCHDYVTTSFYMNMHLTLIVLNNLTGRKCVGVNYNIHISL